MNAQDCRAETSVLQLSALGRDCTWYLGYVCNQLLPSMAVDSVAAKLMQFFFFYFSCLTAGSGSCAVCMTNCILRYSRPVEYDAPL